MSNLRLRVSMSLDGFIAGPNQSVDNPLGVRGMELHKWVFPLEVWRSMHGLQGGIENESSRFVVESMQNIGATIMGRNMFGGHPGAWDKDKPWKGWWGDNPPYHHSVFVLTHHRREPLVLEGGNVFHFVTDGIESALEQARKAAGGKNVLLAGGANVCQQYLRTGQVDQMVLHVVPLLLGSGERLFEGVDQLHGLELVRTLATPEVVHLEFARRSD